jgi:hypothetical protein
VHISTKEELQKTKVLPTQPGNPGKMQKAECTGIRQPVESEEKKD